MRTTVEIRDEQRAQLLKLAARRGEKGFSRLVQEAVDRYLEEVASQEEKIQGALGVLGTLPEDAAIRMEALAGELRESWR